MLRVNGGPAHSGTRIVREAPKVWECKCVTGGTTKHYRQQPGYWTRCPDCGTRRP